MYFDYQTIKSENGIYLLSWNKGKEGMTFWFIDNKTQKLNKIRDLESNWWNLTEKNGKIILSTITKNKDIIIEIEKI